MDRAEDSGLSSAARAAFIPSGGRRNRRLTGLPGGAEAAGRLPLQRQLFPWSPSCWPTLQTGDMPASTTGTGQVTEISPCLLHWRPDVTAISTFSSSPKEALCPSTATARCPLPPVPGDLARVCAAVYCPVLHTRMRGRTARWRPATVLLRGHSGLTLQRAAAPLCAPAPASDAPACGRAAFCRCVHPPTGTWAAPPLWLL